jgi:hypothetical protein
MKPSGAGLAVSSWATIEATFKSDYSLDMELAPRGSEGGLSGPHRLDGVLFFHGRLRDFDDFDSPIALAWFCGHLALSEKAELLIDIDSGPRYRYVWEDGKLTRLRGVLE